tara:strand:- start:792 stop:1292 length:501 start_codon:yes stop_codon:yes gene_type:complete
MALSATGSISFSQIRAEFSTSGEDNSLGAYRALNVEGIPTENAISFGNMRGKSNTLITTVVLLAGHNRTVYGTPYWTIGGNVPLVTASWQTGRDLNGGGMSVLGVARGSGTTYVVGGYRYVRAGEHSTDYDRWIRVYWVRRDTYTTPSSQEWVDTTYTTTNVTRKI